MTKRVWLAAILASMGCGRVLERPPAERTASADSPGASAIVLPPGSPKLKQIRSGPVMLREFPVAEFTAPGKLEVNPNRVSRVLTPVPGRVQRVLVGLGDAVSEGQPLLTVESPEAGQALAAYLQDQAQLRQVRWSLSKAEKDVARLRDLYEHRAAAFKDVLAAEAELAQAQAAVEQAQAAAEAARHRLEVLGLDPARPTREVIIRSPIAGKLLEIAVAPGEYRNDTTAALMTIADLSTIWVTSQVPEGSVRLIQIGERIEIELTAYPGEIFRGRVRRIADTVDPVTRTVKVQAELENRAGRLRPEMFGTIRHTHGYRPLPVVPSAAILRSGTETWVFRETGPGRFERIPVECGEIRNGWVPVLAGLRAGERVVVEGAVLLAGL